MNEEASWTAQDRGPYRLLVVEDEPLMRSIIVQLARSEGYEVMEAPAAEIALHIFEKEKIDLAILDLNLTSGGSGLDLLRQMRELDPEGMGIIVTAYASVESAVEALHQGAYDYITKPFANDHLKKVMRNALDGKALFRENRFLRQELREKYRFESIIGKSDSIEKVFRVMEKVARTDSSVLITGESGTGKELVARAIHFSSERAGNRFLPINCGALPENLLESELFGYKRGAFTGAGPDRDGFFQGRDAPAYQLCVAGQCPRTREHRRARRDPRRDRRHPLARFARQAAQHFAGDGQNREYRPHARGARTRAHQGGAREGRARQGQGRAGARHPSLDALSQSPALSTRYRHPDAASPRPQRVKPSGIRVAIS